MFKLQMMIFKHSFEHRESSQLKTKILFIKFLETINMTIISVYVFEYFYYHIKEKTKNVDHHKPFLLSCLLGAVH